MKVPDGPLHAGAFLLRHWEPEDAEWYVAARDDEVFRWTSESRKLTVAQTRDVLERHRREPAWIGLAITDGLTGELIGNIALSPQPEHVDSAEVSYWLAPEGRGRGAATESVRALCAWAFASLPLARITLRTDPGNSASQAVARRAGFESRSRDGDRLCFELWRA